ncbi:MAG TPA: hypothetical protein PKC18_07740 [Lacipirellulaceae bacterium]|nr:hypothetical protein [Verrucomicrobiota bacterium]HMO84795.1 hypothetical protein [Lacipirellulaceae bacterium]
MAGNTALCAFPAPHAGELSKVIAAASCELAEIRRANRAADAEIRRLRATTRHRLDRIWENLCTLKQNCPAS